MDTAPDVIVVSSLTTPISLVAKGFSPLSAAVDSQEHRVEFLFHAEVKDARQAFYVAKSQLEQMSSQAERESEVLEHGH